MAHIEIFDLADIDEIPRRLEHSEVEGRALFKIRK